MVVKLAMVDTGKQDSIFKVLWENNYEPTALCSDLFTHKCKIQAFSDAQGLTAQPANPN